MKISELDKKISDLSILVDGDFEILDYINSKKNKKVLSFIDNEKYINCISENITCIICSNTMLNYLPKKYGIILADNPRRAFYLLHNFLSLKSEEYQRKRFTTAIGDKCKISEKAIISDANVTIGNNVTIEEYAVIRSDVFMGDNCIIRAGTKIGGEGFQFNKDGRVFFIEHSGGVVIGENVEIQYNTCIDRGLFPWDNTVIGNNSKLDNLIHIGHSAKIGENCLIAANAVIGGSTIVGDDSWIGISATISNGLSIGKNSSIKLGAVVTKNVADGESVSGNFAIEHSKFIGFIKSIS